MIHINDIINENIAIHTPKRDDAFFLVEYINRILKRTTWTLREYDIADWDWNKRKTCYCICTGSIGSKWNARREGIRVVKFKHVIFE